MRNAYIRQIAVLVLVSALLLSAGCLGGNTAKNEEKPTIIFAEQGWDSVRFHDAVAMFIVEKAFGYKVEEVSGSTSVTYSALLNGEVDVFMEQWTDNLSFYAEDLAAGKLIELGINFDDIPMPAMPCLALTGRRSSFSTLLRSGTFPSGTKTKKTNSMPS